MRFALWSSAFAVALTLFPALSFSAPTEQQRRQSLYNMLLSQFLQTSDAEFFERIKSSEQFQVLYFGDRIAAFKAILNQKTNSQEILNLGTAELRVPNGALDRYKRATNRIHPDLLFAWTQRRDSQQIGTQSFTCGSPSENNLQVHAYCLFYQAFNFTHNPRTGTLPGLTAALNNGASGPQICAGLLEKENGATIRFFQRECAGKEGAPNRCEEATWSNACMKEKAHLLSTQMNQALSQLEQSLNHFNQYNYSIDTCKQKYGAGSCDSSATTRPLFAQASQRKPSYVGLNPAPPPRNAGCTPRSPAIESVVDACLNKNCGKESPDAETHCRQLRDLDLLGFASEDLLKSMGYMDADSLVYLTRAKVAGIFPSNYARLFGEKFPVDQIPGACGKNKQFLNGLHKTISDSPAPARGELSQNITQVRETATELAQLRRATQKICESGTQVAPAAIASSAHVRSKSAACEEMEAKLKERELQSPLLLPSSYPMSVASVYTAIDTAKSNEEAIQILRRNVLEKTREGLKETCGADWNVLLQFNQANAAAKEISLQTVRQGDCSKPEHYFPPPDGRCMPWALRCLKGHAEAKAEVSATLGKMCLTMAAGLLFTPVPVVAYGVGAACTAGEFASRLTDHIEKRAVRAFTVQCLDIDPQLCRSEDAQRLSHELDNDIRLLSVEAIGMAVIPPALAESMTLLARGAKMSVDGMRRILAQTRKLRSEIRSGTRTSTTQVEHQAASLNRAIEKESQTSYALTGNVEINLVGDIATQARQIRAIEPWANGIASDEALVQIFKRQREILTKWKHLSAEEREMIDAVRSRFLKGCR